MARAARRSSTPAADLEREVAELQRRVRSGAARDVEVYLATLTPASKDDLLVVLARAVTEERDTRRRQGAEACARRRRSGQVRTLPLALEVRRFARANGLTDDQVWRAVVDLHTAAGYLEPSDVHDGEGALDAPGASVFMPHTRQLPSVQP